MNWMSISLGRLARRALLLGAVAGVWGAFMYLGVSWLLELLGSPAAATIVPGMALGLGLCGLLGPVDDIYNCYWRRALKTGAFAAAMGMAAGGIGFALMWLLASGLGSGAAQWISLPLLMGAFGALAATGSGLAMKRVRRNTRRIVAGLLGGAAAGVPLAALLVLAPGRPWLFVFAFAGWGALVALAVFWSEKKTARRWLRVLTGPGEDTFYPLNGHDLTLGKLESNDIPLLHYNEVFPVHCQLRWEGDHYKIVDQEQGGVVLVNYRQIQEQDLKHGDLVKLGSALLQYGEAK